MTTVKDAATRIKDKFATKNVDLKIEDLEKKISQLVEEFGFSLQAAERAIFGKEARERNVSFYEGKFATAETLRDIGTLKENEWVTVEGKVVSTYSPQTNKIIIAGVIEDRTGVSRFVIWQRNDGSQRIPNIVVGKSYRFSNAIVKMDQNNILTLNAYSNTEIHEINDEGEISSPVSQIASLGIGIANIRAKVIRLYNVTNPKVKYSGVLGDESGTIPFVAWSSDGIPDILEEGKVYQFKYVTVKKNKDKLEAVISRDIKKLDIDLNVKTGDTTIEGNFVQVRQGSGLIRRCVAEGCGRVLSRQNFCMVHELQNTFTYDMRIKGVIDTGVETYNVIIPLSETEKLTGIKMEDAIKIAESSPLGFEDVVNKISSTVIGRYFKVRGVLYPDRFLVSSITPAKFQKSSLEEVKKAVI